MDEAADTLPWEVDADNDGHLTKAAAIALKSRVLLFAASPLFNADEPYLQGDASAQFITWYGNYSADRWQKALDAGLQFMRENNGRYKLVNTGNPREDFAAGYFNRHNGEVLISSRRFTTYMTGKTPFAQIRYGVASPTLNYIDMFQMNDGTEFDWNNPDHKKYPFLIKTEKHAVTSACMRHWPSMKTDSKGKKWWKFMKAQNKTLITQGSTVKMGLP